MLHPSSLPGSRYLSVQKYSSDKYYKSQEYLINKDIGQVGIDRKTYSALIYSPMSSHIPLTQLIAGYKLQAAALAGFPEDVAGVELYGTLSDIQSACNLCIGHILYDKAQYSSGGPIFNYSSEVVGMNVGGNKGGNHAIPINDIEPILENLKKVHNE